MNDTPQEGGPMAAENIGEGRPLRVCDLCGGVDDHPRHVVAGNIDGAFAPSDGAIDRVLAAAPEDQRGRLVRELLDTTSSDRHLQCCRDAGCPEQDPAKQCGVLLADVNDDVIGADLIDHLTSRAALVAEVDSIEEG
jgi:hypothetical protein